MKFNILICLLPLFLLSISCEKRIDLDLNANNPTPVFDAYIENDTTCFVLATWTSSYYVAEPDPLLENAVITISDQQGNSETLNYKGEGIYRGENIKGVIGNTYTLNIDVDGKNYTSTSSIPPLVPIDSLTIGVSQSIYGVDGFSVYANYTDPVDYFNYYTIHTDPGQYYAEKYSFFHKISDDNLYNGNRTALLASRVSYAPLDTVRVTLGSINYDSWLFFKTMDHASERNDIFGSVAPANPTSNISGGALGHFTARSISKKEIVIPQ